MTERSYKYRFYPTFEQEHLLAQTFGCVRYVWNWALDKRTRAYRENGESVNFFELCSALTKLKAEPETAWLQEVSSVALQQSLRNQERAFKNFFEGRAEYPKFKKRRNRQSATLTTAAFSWDGENLKLAKMSEPLDVRWSRRFSGTPSSVTVSKDCAGRYFISIVVREDIKPLPVTSKTVGIDLGITDVVVTSDGVKFGNPRFFQQDKDRLAKAQRLYAKKKNGSKNRDKARLRVARIHAKIQDRRNDFTHKLTTALIHENQVICAESLQVKNMVKNHNLAGAISDVGWGELVRQLEYKSRWYGREFMHIDKFFPSSKMCSQCGCAKDSLPLSMRSWSCTECGANHDRDVNAAINIKAAGLAVLACGETVRPKKVKAKAKTVIGASRRNRKLSA